MNNMQRQRDTAVRALNEYCDSQTPAPFYIDELECTGEERGPSCKRRYIQGHQMVVEWEGVRLEISLQKNSNFGPDGISLSWDAPNRTGDHIAFIPRSFQKAELVAKEKMR